MNRCVTRGVGVLVLASSLACVGPAGEAGGGEASRPVWIYRDMPMPGAEKDPRTDTERQFAPYGFMPAHRTDQIAVNAQRLLDPDHPEKGTVVEYSFKFSNRSDWQGVYTLVGGRAWGDKPGIDVQKLLGVDADAVVYCAFRAWGEAGGETVTFQCGGVNTGAHPSSLRFPRTLDPDPVTLTKEPREYRIKLRAETLTNIIDPFCVVARGYDNRGRDSITIMVDDVRFELPARPEGRSELPKGWRERLATTLFFDYTPTGYDPTAKPPRHPTVEAMRQDLAALRRSADEAGLPRDRAGVVLYGCRDGLEQIPPLCQEVGLSVLLGLWDVRDEAEVQRIVGLLTEEKLRGTIVAVCVGNEAVTFRRATLGQLRATAERLREAHAVPVTTSEIVQMYGKEELYKAFDFALPNVHGLFSVKRPYDPKAGAEWTVARIRDLQKEAPPGYLIVVKEVGWPSGPEPAFSEEGQAAFWRAVLDGPVISEVNICVFEASFGGAKWKREMVPGNSGGEVNIGPFWSVFGAPPERRPNPAGRVILAHAKRLARREAPGATNR